MAEIQNGRFFKGMNQTQKITFYAHRQKKGQIIEAVVLISNVPEA